MLNHWGINFQIWSFVTTVRPTARFSPEHSAAISWNTTIQTSAVLLELTIICVFGNESLQFSLQQIWCGIAKGSLCIFMGCLCGFGSNCTGKAGSIFVMDSVWTHSRTNSPFALIHENVVKCNTAVATHMMGRCGQYHVESDRGCNAPEKKHHSQISKCWLSCWHHSDR